MNKFRFKHFLSALLLCTLVFTLPLHTAFAEVGKIVTLGANLTTAQKDDMLKEFGVNKDEVKIIEITNKDITDLLGGDSNTPGGGNSSFSSSYVELLSKGNGISVETNNLTQVTGNMLVNALITAGITDAHIKASSPFPVTGEAALTGILKGFETSTGNKISETQKKVAQDEVGVVGNLGESVGNDKASSIINDIKTQVIKDKPKNEEQIKDIIVNITNNYNVKLTDEQKKEIQGLMSRINDLDINYDSVKDSLNKFGSEIKNILKDQGEKIKESGFFQKLWEDIKDFFSSLFDKIEKSFNNDNKETTPSESSSTTSPNTDIKSE